VKEWIDEAIKQRRPIWFNMRGGKAVEPVGYEGAGWYLGVINEQRVLFHEDEVSLQSCKED
jgi:hypothetical protein